MDSQIDTILLYGENSRTVARRVDERILSALPAGQRERFLADLGTIVTALGKFKAEKEADLNVIHIGDEHYDIPDAVVQGG